MKKAYIVVILAILVGILACLLIGGISAVSAENTDKADSSILEAINNKGNAEVIVVLKDNSGDIASFSDNVDNKKEKIKKAQDEVIESLASEGLDEQSYKLKYKYSNINVLSLEIDQKTLKALEKNPNVASIEMSPVLSVSLNISLPRIRVTNVQQIQIGGVNLTGAGETACILDTGIDSDHEAFTGRIIGGYDFVNGDANPEDDHGHGTHVAGIVAGNGIKYKGVAPNSNIVAVKVCDSGGSCGWSNVLAGFDWCLGNASALNISTISMSLGDSGQYNSVGACPDIGFNSAMNSARAAGILVPVASGNEGYTSGISFPACVPNATSVGSVLKTESMMAGTNRGVLLDILAPGFQINSAYFNGGYAMMTGTSMATPHIAGLELLLHQLIRLKGLSKTTFDIENAMKNSATVYIEGFPRVDAISSLNYLQYGLIVNSSQNTTARVGVGKIKFVSDPVFGDLGGCIEIQSGNAFIGNGAACSRYNRNATVTLENLPGSNFNVKKDGVACPSNECNLTEAGSTAIFTILGAGNYTVSGAPDTTAPLVTISSPTNIIYSSDSVNVNINLNEAGYCEYSLNSGANNKTLTTADSLTFTATESGLTNGNYLLNAYCRDSSGNRNDSASVSFSVNSSVNFCTNVPNMTDSDSDGYKEVTSCCQLQAMRNDTRSKFELANDIECSDTVNWNNGQGFEPIGGMVTETNGVFFNGNGHKISNLYINRPSEDNVAMLKQPGWSWIGYSGNVTLENVNIIGRDNTAGFSVGHSATIGYVTVTGRVSGRDYVAGVNALGGYYGSNLRFVGTVTGENAVGGVATNLGGGCLLISNITAVADVSGTGIAGGLVGGNSGATLVNSYFIGNVTTTSSAGAYVGAIAGREFCDVDNVYANANVSAPSNGGYVGGLFGDAAAINNSYFIGNVTGGSANTGGLAGVDAGIIRNSYVSGKVHTALGASVGGLVGEQIRGYLTNTSFSGTVKYSRVGGCWYANIGGLVGVGSSSTFSIYNSSSSATMDIAEGGEGCWIGGFLGRSYGNGKIQEAYSNVNISINNPYSVVGGVAGGVMGNLSLLNSYAHGNIVSTGYMSGAGGLVGYLGSVNRIVNCSSSGTVSGGIGYFGGLIGGVNRGIVESSFATGNVTVNGSVYGQGAGGLIGVISGNAQVNNSYATGSVIVGAGVEGGFIGGLVGDMQSGSVTSSYASGDVIPSMGCPTWHCARGGLVGYQRSGSITNSFATGKVKNLFQQTGGLVGGTWPSATITNSHWNNVSSVDATTVGVAVGTGPQFTAQPSVTTIQNNAAYFGNTANAPMNSWAYPPWISKNPNTAGLSGEIFSVSAIASAYAFDDDGNPIVSEPAQNENSNNQSSQNQTEQPSTGNSGSGSSGGSSGGGSYSAPVKNISVNNSKSSLANSSVETSNRSSETSNGIMPGEGRVSESNGDLAVKQVESNSERMGLSRIMGNVINSVGKTGISIFAAVVFISGIAALWILLRRRNNIAATSLQQSSSGL